MSKKEYRSPVGRKLTAKDIAERLLPDLDMNELLLWSPDLFAYTSYVMSLTGAYQLVVSPPSGKTWQPTNGEIKKWLGIKINDTGKFIDDGMKANIKAWLLSFVRKSEPTGEDVEKMRDDKEQEKWGLNAIDWQPFDTDYYFSENDLRKWKRYIAFEEKIDLIVDDIADYVIKSFGKDINGIRLKIEDFNIPSSEKKYKPGSKVKGISYLEGENKRYRIFEDDEGVERVPLGELFKSEYDNESNWVHFVQGVGDAWRERLKSIKKKEFYLINDAELDNDGNPFYDKKGGFIQWKSPEFQKYLERHENKSREEELLGILLKYTPPLLIACWAFFYNSVTTKIGNREIPVSDLLCNRDDLQLTSRSNDLWEISQSLLTMHAIADICCTKWGIETILEEDITNNKAQWFAERLLFDKGSLSTLNPERGRIMPKRHNPGVGITLRSISSNLGFHRSSVEVVWRKTKFTTLDVEIEKQIDNKEPTFSILLLPFPLDVKAKDFTHDEIAEKKVNVDTAKYGFFGYEPKATIESNKTIIELIRRAGEELKDNRSVDVIVFPEDALSKTEYNKLADRLEGEPDFTPPSLFIAGVRESRADVFYKLEEKERNKLLEDEKLKVQKEIDNVSEKLSDVDGKEKEDLEIELEKLREGMNNEEFLINRIINFSRNAVYCKFYDSRPEHKSYTYDPTVKKPNKPLNQTPKHEQYKHHRWQLNSSQIRSYGLSQILDENKIWWESVKIPKRRVSFLNVGNRMTISHLVCEDLARQDPIADLIRHVGPSLVVTLLMDGPQLKNRWSGRYASVLSDDPGSSVIALTCWGMVKRHSSPYGLMSKVIGLWSESGGRQTREIELADGAEAVLLNLKLDKENEKTADGRQEREATSVLRLLDVIQIYPDKIKPQQADGVLNPM